MDCFQWRLALGLCHAAVELVEFGFIAIEPTANLDGLRKVETRVIVPSLQRLGVYGVTSRNLLFRD